jgi:hypothetical protein
MVQANEDDDPCAKLLRARGAWIDSRGCIVTRQFVKLAGHFSLRTPNAASLRSQELEICELYRRLKPPRTMASPTPSEILDGIAAARIAFDKNEAGSREALIDYSRALIAALEIPSEFVQRTFWAEVCIFPRLNYQHVSCSAR